VRYQTLAVVYRPGAALHAHYAFAYSLFSPGTTHPHMNHNYYIKLTPEYQRSSPNGKPVQNEQSSAVSAPSIELTHPLRNVVHRNLKSTTMLQDMNLPSPTTATSHAVHVVLFRPR
jgi:hypothetical protein